MLIKKFFGMLILILNLAGLGYLLYIGAVYLWTEYVSGKEAPETPASSPVPKKQEPNIANDNIIMDEDDLLKDLDLSDLDDLNLDDLD